MKINKNKNKIFFFNVKNPVIMKNKKYYKKNIT